MTMQEIEKATEVQDITNCVVNADNFVNYGELIFRTYLVKNGKTREFDYHFDVDGYKGETMHQICDLLGEQEDMLENEVNCDNPEVKQNLILLIHEIKGLLLCLGLEQEDVEKILKEYEG